MTLVEILVVMVLLALVVSAVVVGSGQIDGSRLKKTATNISGAVRVAYTRSTATSKNIRLVLDIEGSAMWLEEGDVPMLVQTKDRTGTGGADPVTEQEKLAVSEGDRIIKGPRAPRPFFKAIDDLGVTPAEGGKGPRKLDRNIHFREVQTAHDDAPLTKGRAYLYFWPGGLTERASIQIRIGESNEDSSTLSLLVAPLTGKVTVKSGPVPVPQPADDKEASEREDKSF
jgi:general secretion pathway protein H